MIFWNIANPTLKFDEKPHGKYIPSSLKETFENDERQEITNEVSIEANLQKSTNRRDAISLDTNIEEKTRLLEVLSWL